MLIIAHHVILIIEKITLFLDQRPTSGINDSTGAVKEN